MRFFLDHDVPGDLALLLRHWKHEAVVLKEVLPVNTTDEDAFAYARRQWLIMLWRASPLPRTGNGGYSVIWPREAPVRRGPDLRCRRA